MHCAPQGFPVPTSLFPSDHLFCSPDGGVDVVEAVGQEAQEEQVVDPMTPGSKAMRPHFIQAMKDFEVWDYSERNVKILQENYGVIFRFKTLHFAL